MKRVVVVIIIARVTAVAVIASIALYPFQIKRLAKI